MSARNTWPEPETVLSRLEKIRLAPLRSHPDLWVGDAVDLVSDGPLPSHVESWLTDRYAGHNQRESRTYTGNHIDRTAPQRSYPAPGPALNIYPRAQRSLIERALRLLKGS